MSGVQKYMVVNSSQYAPVYLIQDPKMSTVASYVVSPNVQSVLKPVTYNLKTFYENLFNDIGINSEAQIMNTLETRPIENKINFSNQAPPKNENSINMKSVNIVNSVLLNSQNNEIKTQTNGAPKSVNIVNSVLLNSQNKEIKTQTNGAPKSVNIVNSVLLNSQNNEIKTQTNGAPKLDILRKIIKLKPVSKNSFNQTKIPPKIMPNLRTVKTETVQSSQPVQFTEIPQRTAKTDIVQSSSQVVKYIELPQILQNLNNQNKKVIISRNLKSVPNNENKPSETSYDPVTNTRTVYKIISPNDLKVVGKNKIVIKEKKKESTKLEQKSSVNIDHTTNQSRTDPVKETVTRSGRKVKVKKYGQIPHKPKKKPAALQCFECWQQFSTTVKLQQHYESSPSHVPVNMHSNLFHCLLGIIKSGPPNEKANTFVQQLEHLIEKIKTLLPCMLKKIDGREGDLCTISEDLGKLCGMNPGKYNLNIEALNCIKDKSGHCPHNPPKISPFQLDISKTPRVRIVNQGDNTNLNIKQDAKNSKIHVEEEQVPGIKRLRPHAEEENSVKRIKVSSEDSLIAECAVQDLSNFIDEINNYTKEAQCKTDSVISCSNSSVNTKPIQEIVSAVDINPVPESNGITETNDHTFFSTHFDIRSSPIKSSSTVFHKFQISPLKINGFDKLSLQPLSQLDSSENKNKCETVTHTDESTVESILSSGKVSDIVQQSSDENSLDLHGLFPHIAMQRKDEILIHPEIHFTTNKDWETHNASRNNCDVDNATKTKTENENGSIKTKELSLLENQDRWKIDNSAIGPTTSHIVDQTATQQPVLSFLDSLDDNCLSYPEPEIRNDADDFNLDMFTFSNP